MKILRISAAAALAAVFFSTSLPAESVQDVEGSKDHPLLARYPGFAITKYSSVDFDEFTLPLGRVKEDNTLEKSQKLQGKITRIEYAGPAGRSVLEIYRNYHSALVKAGFRILFECSAEACNPGNEPVLWASNGAEDWLWTAGHRYLSARLTRSSGDVWVSLHVGKWGDEERGTQTVLYVVEPKPMDSGLVKVDAAALATDITATGHVAVYGIYFDTASAVVKPESDAALKEIAQLLGQNAQLQLLVVGHTDAAGSLATNMDLSRRRAAAVVQILTTKYAIAASRLNAQGAGPLAPVASNKTEEGRGKNRRVELVEQ